MLQPLTCVHIGGGGGAGGGSSGGTVGGGGDAGLLVVDIPLPLEQRGGAKACIVTGGITTLAAVQDSSYTC